MLCLYYSKFMKNQKISALKATDRQAFIVNFRHPQTFSRISRSLQTRDENLAKQIALDLEKLANNPELWHLPIEAPVFLPLEERALEIFFGKPIERKPLSNAVSPQLRAAIEVLSKAGLLKHIGKIEENSHALAEERKLRVQAEQRALRSEREKQDLESELARYRKALNRHVDATLEKAAEKFKKIYRQGHAEGTIRAVNRTVTAFMTTVGADKNVGKVGAREIDRWLREYGSNLHNRELSPITRQRCKAYLSVFWKWACREYDLTQNPMANTAPIAGVSRYPENIRAIRRLNDLQALLEGLKPWPYWRTWVATAILAGPRWAEQAWLKVEDIFLDDGYLRITSRASGPKLVGTKTGRERNVPIEKTILLPILRDYLLNLEHHHPWAFPSSLSEEGNRKKTPAGLWSGSSAFLDAWRTVATTAKEKSGGSGEFWTYGPSEWRHSFGTALGMSGFSPLEISRLMGNSAQIAERHYIAIVSQDAGKRWPLKWI
jgi:site-specific recombinase XerD